MSIDSSGGAPRKTIWSKSKSPVRNRTTHRNVARQISRATFATLEALESRLVLSAPPLPVIPSGAGHDFLVTASPFNAVGDGLTDNTTAIQNAINEAATIGGGTVEIPAGTFEAGALTMASNVNLQVDSGGTLQALPGLTGSVWISVTNATNWEISGTGSGATMGALDGHANGGIGSLNMIRITNSSVGLFQTIQVNNSPHEHIQCGSGDNNITVNGVTINTPANTANTDGIDPAGTNWLIENCTISDGDDDIALKPESQACSNIDIENCLILAGHGISVGGQTQAGLNGLTVNNVTFNGTTNGLRLKAGEGNGGLVQNITYSNITMTNVANPIVIDSYYNNGLNNFPTDPTADPGSTPDSLTPIFSNIHFTNVTSTSTTTTAGANGGLIFGLPDEPITNVSFANVKITAPIGMEINHVRGITFDTNSHFTIASGGDLVGETGGTFPVPIDAQITAANFTNQSVGSPTIPFDTSLALFDPNTGGTSIAGLGSGFGGTGDSFSQTTTAVTGNSTFTAQLTSLSGSSTPAAGVIDELPGSTNNPFVAVLQTTGNQLILESRTTVGGAVTESTPIAEPVGSLFLRIERSGNIYTGFFSTDNSTFTQVGSPQTINVSGSAQVGFVATASSNGAVADASFANITLLNSAGPTGPVIVNAAAATLNPNGKTITLTALASDPAGAGALTYNWSATAVPPGVAAPTFDSKNNTNAGQNETATVSAAGTYTFLVTITDTNHLSITSSVSITVTQTATSLTISPANPTINKSTTEAFSATEFDQFSTPMAFQPAFTWTLDSGPGSINPTTGVYSAPSSGGTSAVVRATAGSITNTTTVTISLVTINEAPTVATPAAANPSAVTGTSTALSVLGADDGGEPNLTYTWAATAGPASVMFSSNGSNASKNTTATFTKAGNYSFTVTIQDTGGLSTTSTVNVTVDQTITSLQISPGAVTVDAAGSEPFTATALDQFGTAMATQPAITWSLDSGVGSIDSNTGLYLAPSGTGSAAIRATAGGATGTATVTIKTTAVNQPPTVLTAATATPGTATGNSTSLLVLGADDNGESNLTYTWAATAGPAAVAFSSNGNNNSKNTTVTFIQAGSYTLTVTITDSGGLTVTSSVPVTVNQTVALINVAPLNSAVAPGASEQLAATAIDQFGNPLLSQPGFSWSTESGSDGIVSATGVFTAGGQLGAATVAASADGVTGMAGITVTSASSSAPPPTNHAKLVFIGQPLSAEVGSTLNTITVDIDTSHGQLSTTDDSDVTISIGSGARGATLSGTLTVTAVNGVATFSDLSINKEGPFTLRATDATIKKATSHRFALTPQLVWGQDPSDVVAGTSMTPPITIDVEGSTGQLVTNDHSMVKLLLETGPTGARATGVTARVINGVATFSNLMFKKAGGYTLETKDGKLAAVTSGSFNVTPAAAAKMIFSTQPIATGIGDDFSVQVELLDRFGNLATNDSSTVSLLLTGRPNTTTLGGATTAGSSGGFADFTGLTVDTAGHYQLTATDTEIVKGAKSKSFAVS